MKKIYDMVGLGACGVDFVAEVNTFADKDNKITTISQSMEAGGVTANNLVQCAKLANKVVWCGALGHDKEGEFLVDEFKKNKVSVHTKLFKKTQSCWIAVDKKGERQIYLFPNASRQLRPSHVNMYFENIIMRAKHFHTEVAAIPFTCAITGARIAKYSGAKVFLDIDIDVHQAIKEGLGTRGDLEILIKLADIIKLSESGMKSLFKNKTRKKGMQSLLKTAQLVAITRGSKGCILATKEKTIVFPVKKVDVIDTTGAGDAFMGGLSHAILHNFTLESTGVFANSCGAYTCTKKGARNHVYF